MTDRTTATPELLNQIRDLFVEALEIPHRAGQLEAGTELLGDIPELDSMAVLTVLTAIEDRFDIVIDDDEFSGEIFETLGSLTEFVAGKLNG